MLMLSDVLGIVIGVATHNDTHTVAILGAGTGAALGPGTVTADPYGLNQSGDARALMD